MPTSTDVTNLKINQLTQAQYDTAVQQGIIGPHELSVITDASSGGSIQVDSMPVASVSEEGNIYQFVGTTDVNYTNGYFYKCSGAPSSATISQTTGTSLSDLAVDIDTFETQITTSGSYAFQYDDFESSWTFGGNNINLADYGITYNGTPQDWDIITVVYSAGSYAWSRVDVQPAPVIPDPLPSQTGQSGKFLTTDGTDASWATVTGLKNAATFWSSLAIQTESGYGADVTSATDVVAIGAFANASAGGAIAIGPGAKATAAHAIMISSDERGVFRTNNEPNTFKVGNANGSFEIMSADGTVPHGRLTNAVVPNVVTIAVADWNGGTTCTKTISGLTATSVVWVAPDNASQSDYLTAGVYASAQATDTITFTCTTTPTSALTVNVIYC